jgi:hypothetical protein
MSICTDIMAIPLVWNEVLSGTSDELVTHKVLIWTSLVGEVLVSIGILLEIERPLNLKKILSFAAVIIGVVISAAGTLLLLNFDEAISGAQQSKIIALETRIAPRVVEKEQYDAIQTLRGKVRAVSVFSSPDVEPAMFGSQLDAALDDAGVAINPISNTSETRMVGMQICLPDNETKESPLWQVFSSILEMDPKPCSFSDTTLSIPKGVPKDVPLIIVGERPLFWPNGKPTSLRMRAYPGFAK